MGSKQKTEIICRCNNVSRKTIEDSIRNGAKTLNEIFDSTTAGVGPCGGSCRRKIGPLLEYFLKHGEFPEKITENCSDKSSDKK
ncbi:MAG: (2Fe-2S)-binding protein [Pseudobdellovibrionaceae bacterium]